MQNAVLPLQWLSFTLQKHEKAVKLDWSTASEQHTKEFIVQHSVNGTDWRELGKVPAAGNSSSVTRYSYTHLSPAKNINYYRLLQVDIDGRKSYSEVRTIRFDAVGNSFSVLNNPVENGEISIKLNTTDVISLFSSDGKLLMRKKFAPGIVRLNQYSKGVYFLRGTSRTEKIVIK
jgi:hypothetical protein